MNEMEHGGRDCAQTATPARRIMEGSFRPLAGGNLHALYRIAKLSIKKENHDQKENHGACLARRVNVRKLKSAP